MLIRKQLVQIRVRADPDRIIEIPVRARPHGIAFGLAQKLLIGRRGGDAETAQTGRDDCDEHGERVCDGHRTANLGHDAVPRGF